MGTEELKKVMTTDFEQIQVYFRQEIKLNIYFEQQAGCDISLKI